MDRTVIIVINKDRSLMLNTEPVAESALQERLMAVFKTRAELSLIHI